MGNFDFEAGRGFLREGDVVEAIRSLLASLDLDPANLDAYLTLLSAYDLAWKESGDPMVLDQMRKVALAGLKRSPDPERRRHLQESLDRVDAALLEIDQAEREDEERLRRLPMIDDIVPPRREGGP